MIFEPRAVSLNGSRVLLEPLEHRHIEQLARTIADPATRRYLPECLDTRDQVGDCLKMALEGLRNGTQIPFVIVERASFQIVGSTRYLEIRRRSRGLEIGWTWIATGWRGLGLNTEATYLLLAHAFEELGAIRVEFKTDARNELARKAALRIGAVEEGVFRRHMVCPDGHVRDTVYFSIVDTEWLQTQRLIQRVLSKGNATL